MVRRQPIALQHASFRRRRNLEIVLAALEQDPRVLVLAIVNSAGHRALERQRDCMRVFFEKLQFDKDELESRTARIATIPEDLQLLPESSHPYSADRPKAIRPLPWHYWRALWPRANHLKVAGESRALVSHHSNFILCLCRTARTLAKRCGISACPPRLPTQACLGSCPELCPELALEREAWRKFTGGAWIITLLTVGVLPIILYDKEFMIVACPIAAKFTVI
jgi:hypothetical protein